MNESGNTDIKYKKKKAHQKKTPNQSYNKNRWPHK